MYGVGGTTRTVRLYYKRNAERERGRLSTLFRVGFIAIKIVNNIHEIVYVKQLTFPPRDNRLQITALSGDSLQNISAGEQ